MLFSTPEHPIQERPYLSRRRKPPQLRVSSGYWRCECYKPDGIRTTVNFGPVDGRPESKVREIHSQWLKLYDDNPHSLFRLSNPYDAVASLTNTMVFDATVVIALDAYDSWLQARACSTKTGNIGRMPRLRRFLAGYHNWPVMSPSLDQRQIIRSHTSDQLIQITLVAA